MKNAVQRVPVPLCAVTLGMAALGNLLQSYSEGLRYACGAAAGLLLVLILLKLILFPRLVREDLKNPVMASVGAAFPMSLMLLSVYAKPWLGPVSYFIWLLAIGLHAALIVYFTRKFVLKLDMPRVFASYFIVYAGFSAAGVTAPAYQRQALGAAIVWFAMVSVAPMLVLVTVRYLRYPGVAEAAQPLICIYAAPANICLAGYLQSAQSKFQPLVWFLLLLGTALWLFSLVKALGYLRLPFYPSYGSFTFPFVISAVAAKQSMAFFAGAGAPQAWLGWLVPVETVVAALLTLYTLVRFLQFIFAKKAK